MRAYVTRAQLLELMNRQLAEDDDCEYCQFSGLQRLKEPEADGRNWSDIVHITCSGRAVDLCADTDRRVLQAALGRYNLCDDDGRISDLSFEFRGHDFRCLARSGGIASVNPEGPWAQPVNSMWWVTVDGTHERPAFPSGSDDTDAHDLRSRIVGWFQKTVGQ